MKMIIENYSKGKNSIEKKKKISCLFMNKEAKGSISRYHVLIVLQ